MLARCGRLVAALTALVLLASACSSSDPAEPELAQPSPTEEPTAAPTPTLAPPTPTPEPTITPDPTATPAPTPTPVPALTRGVTDGQIRIGVLKTSGVFGDHRTPIGHTATQGHDSAY